MTSWELLPAGKMTLLIFFLHFLPLCCKVIWISGRKGHGAMSTSSENINLTTFWQKAGQDHRVNASSIRKTISTLLHKADKTKKTEEAQYFNHSEEVHEQNYVFDDKVDLSAMMADRIHNVVWKVSLRECVFSSGWVVAWPVIVLLAIR